MTSFAVTIDPGPAPRLAAILTLVHAGAAASPWLVHCPPALAVPASLLAVAGLGLSLARVPGPHCRLQAVALDAGNCRVRLSGCDAWQPAEVTRATRAAAGGVALELRVAGRRHGWLLPRAGLPAGAFRRLKALIRLAW
jgi:hypothetical protein